MDKDYDISPLIKGLQAIEDEYKPMLTPAEVIVLQEILEAEREINPEYNTEIDSMLLKMDNYKG